MEFTVWLQYLMAVLEVIFLVLALYHLIKGVKSKDYTRFKRYGLIYLILNLLRHVVEFGQKKAVAVSVIGGADGPTSVFIAGNVGNGFLMIEVLLVAVIVAIFLYRMKKK